MTRDSGRYRIGLASLNGLQRLQDLRNADRHDELAAMFEDAACRYEEAGDDDASDVFRLGAAANRGVAEEARMRWRWRAGRPR